MLSIDRHAIVETSSVGCSDRSISDLYSCTSGGGRRVVDGQCCGVVSVTKTMNTM